MLSGTTKQIDQTMIVPGHRQPHRHAFIARADLPVDHGGRRRWRHGPPSHDLNAGIWIPDKFNPGTLKSHSKLFDGVETRGYRAVQAFQSTHGRNRDPGIDRKLLLLPSDERPCRSDLTCNYKHRSPSFFQRVSPFRRVAVGSLRLHAARMFSKNPSTVSRNRAVSWVNCSETARTCSAAALVLPAA